MAIIVVCSVRDVVASTFGRPFFVPNVPSAVRSLRHEVNSNTPDNMICRNPGDFELYELGRFDDETALFELLPQPQHVVRCDSLVDVPRPD